MFFSTVDDFHKTMLGVALNHPQQVSDLISSSSSCCSDGTENEEQKTLSYDLQLSFFVAYAMIVEHQNRLNNHARNHSQGEQEEKETVVLVDEGDNNKLSKEEEILISELRERNTKLESDLESLKKDLELSSETTRHIESALRETENDKLHFRYETKKMERQNEELKGKIKELCKEKNFLMDKMNEYMHSTFVLEGKLISLKVELAHLKAAEDERLYFMEQIKSNYGFSWLSKDEIAEEKRKKKESDKLIKEGKELVKEALKLAHNPNSTKNKRNNSTIKLGNARCA